MLFRSAGGSNLIVPPPADERPSIQGLSLDMWMDMHWALMSDITSRDLHIFNANQHAEECVRKVMDDEDSVEEHEEPAMKLLAKIKKADVSEQGLGEENRRAEHRERDPSQ